MRFRMCLSSPQSLWLWVWMGLQTALRSPSVQERGIAYSSTVETWNHQGTWLLNTEAEHESFMSDEY